MIYLLPLEDGLRKPVQSEVHGNEAEDGHHRHKSIICGGEETGQDDGADHLQGKPQAVGKDCDPGAPNGETPEPVGVHYGAKGAILVEGLHLSS